MSGEPDAVRVLLVDGDPEFAERAAATLEREDDRFDVVPVSSVADGSDRLASSAFDCVVSDHDPPAVDGVDFLETVRERDAELPFVVFAGAGSEAVASAALAAGATDYLPKGSGSGQFEELAGRVDDAVTRARRDRPAYEHRFDALFDDPNILVGLLDTDGTVLDVNETALEYVDADRNDVVGDPFWETQWWSTEVQTDIKEKIELAARGEYVGYDASHTGPNGEARDVSGVIRPVTDDAGTVRSLIVSARDVTESRERQRALERQNQRLEEFAEVLTHDLRNPLTIAVGYLDVLKQSPDEKAFRKCENALDRIESLIDEVQASILQNRSEPEEVPVDLATAAHEAWSTADTRGATLEVDGEMRLRADPDQFRRLLENLFQNSAEHGISDGADGADGGRSAGGPGGSAGGESELTVRVVALEDGFAVDDDGDGLPPDVADDVFERGFTTSRNGTGFGLSFVRNIAESHGWNVAVEESPAGGARFHFSQVLRSAESVVEMGAGGADIWNRADEGHFYYEAVEGDFDVRVNVPLVENTHAWAKAGIMVRSSTDPAARNVMVRQRPNGAATLQWRPHDGLEARSLTSDLGRHQQKGEVGEPQSDWLRLVREGATFRAYTSETGEDDDWQLLAELTESELQIPDEAVLGIAGTSHNQAESTTVRFKHLAGVDPEHSEDLGDPIRSGSVRTIQPTAAAVRDPVDVTPTDMTLRGVVESSDPVEDLTVHFEYREVMAEEWRTTDPQRASGTGEIRAEIDGLEPRRYYEYKVVADFRGATLESGTTALVATPSRSPGATTTGPRSSAHFDPSDGFADVAPWLDDDTPVVTVTEPDPAQLDRALSVDGPRVVVFETSGTVDLAKQDVTITNDECWIAGQTAPSPGITLIRGRLMVAADDCVIQHLRARPGDAGLSHADEFIKEGIRTDDETENVVVDHCTATWGVKENQSIGHHTDAATFSNCLIAEGLRDSIHPKGERAYGTLIGDHTENVALLGNLWAHNCDWNPRLKDHTHAVLTNNVRYHYNGGVEVSEGARAAIEGDVFTRALTERSDVFGDGVVYATDNDHAWDDEQLHVGDRIRTLADRPHWAERFDRLVAAQVHEHVLAHAGARPADRSDHDERIVRQVRAGEGELVDSQDAVGGYPDLPENREPLDVPTRNLRAWLREQARAVEP